MNQEKKYTPPLVIEFVGLYGSGKTVTAHELKVVLEAKGFHVRLHSEYVQSVTKVSKVYRWTRYLTFSPNWLFFWYGFRNLLRSVFAVEQLTSSHNVRLWLEPGKEICDTQRFFSQNPEVDFFIFDESNFNRSAIYAGNFMLSKSEFQHSLAQIKYPLQPLLVVFDADLELSIKRTGDRNYYVNDKKPMEERKVPIEILAQRIPEMARFIKSSSIPYVFLSPTDPIASNVEKILERLSVDGLRS